MKIYTRTGDAGETTLLGGSRVSKDHHRVVAYGTVDELNASVGWARIQVQDEEVQGHLEVVQHDLFALGSLLATATDDESRRTPKGLPDAPSSRIGEMEAWIDGADEELAPLRAFILPGGSPGAAALHVARTVCRRAERAVVHLAIQEPVEEGIVIYLNRLSDLLFTFARLENLRAGAPDAEWHKGG
jgi:cob(I)alamin adenosyltransferase